MQTDLIGFFYEETVPRACPKCAGSLHESDSALKCGRCGLALRKDLPIFRCRYGRTVLIGILSVIPVLTVVACAWVMRGFPWLLTLFVLIFAGQLLFAFSKVLWGGDVVTVCAIDGIISFQGAKLRATIPWAMVGRIEKSAWPGEVKVIPADGDDLSPVVRIKLGLPKLANDFARVVNKLSKHHMMPGD